MRNAERCRGLMAEGGVGLSRGCTATTPALTVLKTQPIAALHVSSDKHSSSIIVFTDSL